MLLEGELQSSNYGTDNRSGLKLHQPYDHHPTHRLTRLNTPRLLDSSHRFFGIHHGNPEALGYLVTRGFSLNWEASDQRHQMTELRHRER